jgi:hypothetical protein
VQDTLRYIGERTISRVIQAFLVTATIIAAVLIAASIHPVVAKNPASFIGIAPANKCCNKPTHDIRRGLFWTP